jgi:hypothetical protein
MGGKAEQDTRLWGRVVARLERETADLGPDERGWIEDHLAAIARVQGELHALFLKADGPRACETCRGACCERGKYHPTLANLMMYLLEGVRPPAPDFSRSCPFLGETGCLMVPGRRPFNCVTFLCETVEERLSPAERDAFYALEKILRTHYEALARRYAGAGLRGVLNRAEGLESLALLARR